MERFRLGMSHSHRYSWYYTASTTGDSGMYVVRVGPLGMLEPRGNVRLFLPGRSGINTRAFGPSVAHDDGMQARQGIVSLSRARQTHLISSTYLH